MGLYNILSILVVHGNKVAILYPLPVISYQFPVKDRRQETNNGKQETGNEINAEVSQMRTQVKTSVKPWSPAREFLPLILGKSLEDELDSEEQSKLELFEKGLAKALKSEDTIEQAITKIVKMALAAEFGPSLVTAKGANLMIAKICRMIQGDAQLRKQALVIVDRFTNE
jgi:hypothetical protein